MVVERVWDRDPAKVVKAQRIEGGACFACIDAAIDAVKVGREVVILVKEHGVNLVPLQANCAVHEAA